MERLLLLHLESKGTLAQVFLNGVPVAHTPALGGRACVPVHEFSEVGANVVHVHVGPPSAVQPVIAKGAVAVRVLLALCTQGQSPLDPNARILAKMEWAVAARQRHDWPHQFSQTVDLPVAFPRWRWLEAPPVPWAPEVQRQALVLLQNLALDFQVGESNNWVELCRLRTQELAVAYQCTAQSIEERMRAQIQKLYEAGQLQVQAPAQDDIVWLPIANGQLMECLGLDGLPLLRTPASEEPSHSQTFWPLRLAYVNKQFYALR